MATGGGGGDTIKKWTSHFAENLTEQNDEVLAVQSIYEGEETRLQVLSEPPADVIDNPDADKSTFYTIQLTVPVSNETDKFQVDVCIPEDMDETPETEDEKGGKKHGIDFKRSISGHRLMGTFYISHLTPIKLLVVLPPEYPLCGPPMYTLSCMWLSQHQLGSLCEVLDKLWMESSSLPVLFTWMDWLENNALSHLGINNQVLLTQSDAVELDDRRAYNECYSIEEGINSMLEHDRQQMLLEFQRSEQECHICYMTKPGNEFYRMNQCNHHFCRECMADFCKHHVKEGTVFDLLCPESKCKVDIPPYVIQSVLDTEECQRYETLVLRKGLDRMGDIVWCPRCQRPVIREEEESLNLAHCTSCFYSFCTNCLDAWHQGLECYINQEEDELAEKKILTVKKESDAKAMLRKIIRKREEDLSRKMVLGISRKCPKCKYDIQKDGGCNKVTCSMCYAAMCWACGKDISTESYKHFDNNIKCSIFTNEAPGPAYVPVERPQHQAVVRMEYLLAVNPDARNDLLRCPGCKQRNLRNEKNNHIKCYSCNRNLCFQCKKVITDSPVTKHFTFPNVCKQHSSD